MYLKNIEVHGFKSFANKLVFEFHNGITGIVGPNGSGKSNVADAVRWVLGEQSAKQLRGASMQDVIFAGTELRKPQSYAYVALTITNEDHVLNVPYEEVQVARRVYRSGESEYLLNGASCRLKDVQELFFDTGIGKEGYSIIGQGQIDRILSGKPEERRELFDEAAGIVKFKKRKATAEKNLDAESQNLLRVKDILTELEKQVGPLEEQSEKAREYLHLKEDLKNYEIGLFLQDYDSFHEELEEVGGNISNTERELEEEKERQASTKTEFEHVEHQIQAFDEQLERKKEKCNKDRLLCTEIEGEIKVAREKLSSLSDGKEYQAERMANIQAGIEQAEQEKQGYLKTQKDLLERLAEKQAQENTLLADESRLSAELTTISDAITDQNAIIDSTAGVSSEIHLEKQKTESMMEQNSIRRAELNRQILSNKSQMAAAAEDMEREEKALEGIRATLDAERQKKQELLQKAEENRNAAGEVRRQLEEQRKQYHINNSRLTTLKNITERYDGYGQSIRRVMEQKTKHRGILGVVADIIQVEKKYETAVETALGGNIQNIVTEDEQTAKQMIDFLKKNRYGRATFLPLTTVSAQSGRIRPEVLHENGVIGCVAALVTKEEKYDGLIEYLLGSFVLVDTIDHALKLGRKYHHSLRIVTLEGELLRPGGSMSGGAYKNSSNLLGRRREMEKLEDEIRKIKTSMEKQEQKIDKREQEAEKARRKAGEKDSVLRELELKENTASLKYEQAVSVKEEKEAEYHSIVKDGRELEEQKNVLEDTLSRIVERLEESQKANETAKSELEQASERIERVREELSGCQQRLTELKVDISSDTSQQEFLVENLEKAERLLTERRGEYEMLVNEQDHSDCQAEEMEQSIRQFDQRVAALREEIAVLEQEIEESAKKKDELMASQKDFFDRRNEMMERIGKLDKECFRLSSRKEKLEEQLEARINYMWSEYEITYHNAKELMAQTDLSYTRMKNLVAETKDRIRTLGDVNVNAIEDFKNVSERYSLLKTQHDDLIESEEALKKIIAELDEEMRKQFSEKFAQIKSQFDKVFRELFGGGKGTLELVEEEDVLVAGIRIIAQPPGKKLQNMMQLSGGEKALTAIALLFAIQNLKPSPFCLLDEIEAALDDSNVKRYAKYLHKLTKNTQFIVITHRQGTMSAADALYGITMQEKGVSTLVSVKLIEEQLKSEESVDRTTKLSKNES
ncbi:MAG: chromosome segregation protein SMC [Eubacterium sp.]|jgi:chromosome segregation protein|nr:chromosome segregation protein SMC [Eubacterium sp.]